MQTRKGYFQATPDYKNFNNSVATTLLDCEIDRLAWKIFRHCVSGLFKQIKSTIHAQRFLHHVTHMDVEH